MRNIVIIFFFFEEMFDIIKKKTVEYLSLLGTKVLLAHIS